MSRDNLSTTLLEAIFSQSTDQVYLVLITFSSDELSYDLNFVNNYENITSNGVVYQGYPFKISLPHDTAKGMPSVKLTIDNVSREIIDEIRTLIAPPNIEMNIILASDPDTLEDGPYNLTLRRVVWDKLTIQGTIQDNDILNQKYGEIFSPQNFPGLFL